MEQRIQQELQLLRSRYEVEYQPEGRWVGLSPVPTGPGWSEDPVPTAFQIPAGYAATPPYGFYVPADLAWEGQRPKNCQPAPPTQPPFGGPWMMLSGTHHEGWHPTADLLTGSNLLNWALSFQDRFRGGA